jgi:hypothetical protein
VLAVGATRYSVLFKHYTLRDDGTFMASVTVDGKNGWLKDGEYMLGFRAARVDKITQEQFSAQLGATTVIDVSKLILVNRSGGELTLTLGAPVAVTSYTAKLYDKELNATWSAVEGQHFGGRQIKSINAEQVVIVNEDGNELVLPAK